MKPKDNKQNNNKYGCYNLLFSSVKLSYFIQLLQKTLRQNIKKFGVKKYISRDQPLPL